MDEEERETIDRPVVTIVVLPEGTTEILDDAITIDARDTIAIVVIETTIAIGTEEGEEVRSIWREFTVRRRIA